MVDNMEKELVLKVMREAGKPIAAGEVATLSGLDRKVVDKVFAFTRTVKSTRHRHFRRVHGRENILFVIENERYFAKGLL